jgi:hypothetical protein
MEAGKRNRRICRVRGFNKTQLLLSVPGMVTELDENDR